VPHKDQIGVKVTEALGQAL